MAKKKKRNIKKKGGLFTQDMVPVKRIVDHVVHYKDGSFARIVEVDPINFSLLGPEEQEGVIAGFASYLKVSPPIIRFKSVTKRANIDKHIQSLYIEWQNEKNTMCLNMGSAYINLIKTLSAREALARRFYVIIPFTGKDRSFNEIASILDNDAAMLGNRLISCGNTVKNFSNPAISIGEVFYSHFNKKKSQAVSFVSHINDIAGTVMKGRGLDPAVDQCPPIPMDAYLAPTDIDFTHPDYYIMDGMYCTHLYIKKNGFRTKEPGGWLTMLVNAGEGIDVDIQFERKDKWSIISDVSRSIRFNRSKMRDKDDSNTDFEELSSAISSASYIKAAMQMNNEDFYYMTVMISVSAPTYEAMDSIRNQLIAVMRSHDYELGQCKWDMEEAMKSAAPGTYISKSIRRKAERNVMTSGAASTYMFSSFEMTDENGILMGVNRANTTLCILDLWNTSVYPNANMVILGTSGSGKTFTMQLMALRMRLRGIQSFIIAPFKGYEFKRACEQIGGTYIKISPSSQHCINILEIRPVDTGASAAFGGGTFDPTQDKYLSRKTQQVKAFFSLLLPQMNNIEETLLDEALIECYERKGITDDNDSIYLDKEAGILREMPILGDLHKVLMEKEGCMNLATVLSIFVNGSAKSFNQQTNIDLSNKYIVLDISEMKGKMLPIGMFIALDYVMDNVMADITKKKAVYIDEVWKLIGTNANSYAADFVLECFKTIRGYGGSAIAATQDLHDFFALNNGEFGKGILNNANTKLILKLEPNEAAYVKEILDLSVNEISTLRGANRGEGLIVANRNKIHIQIKASPVEHDLITTNREDLERIAYQKMREEEQRRRAEAANTNKT